MLVCLGRIFVLLLILSSKTTFASERNFSLILDKIQKKQSTEKGGDELYFSISRYSNKKNADIKRIPMFPHHWLSSDLNKLNSSEIFKDNLLNGETMRLIITLVEHDVPPWDIDDHIGSLKLVLQNNNGHIKQDWSIPELLDQTDVKATGTRTFLLKGDNGEYLLRFKVKLDS